MSRSMAVVCRLLVTVVLVGATALTPAPPAPVLAAASVEVPARGQSPAIDKIKASGTLRAGIAVAPPWLAQDPKTSQYFGPAISIGTRAAELLGVKLQIIPSGWDTIIAGLQAQQFDVALAPLFATPQRRAVVDFVNYTEGGTCYAVRKDDARITDLSDLNSPSVVIGTFTGTGTETAIKAKYPKARINSVAQGPGGGTRVIEVITKRIDVAPFDSPLAVVLQDKYREIRVIPRSAEYCIEHPDIPIPIGLAFNKGDPALARFLQAVVTSMQSEINAEIVKYSTPRFLSIGKE